MSIPHNSATDEKQKGSTICTEASRLPNLLAKLRSAKTSHFISSLFLQFKLEDSTLSLTVISGKLVIDIYLTYLIVQIKGRSRFTAK